MAAVNWHNDKFLKTFGELLTYTVAGVGTSVVRTIFDQEYFDELPGIGLQARRISARLLEADLPGLAVGTTVERAGTTYRVVQVMPDGHGLVEVKLEEQ